MSLIQTTNGSDVDKSTKKRHKFLYFMKIHIKHNLKPFIQLGCQLYYMNCHDVHLQNGFCYF